MLQMQESDIPRFSIPFLGQIFFINSAVVEHLIVCVAWETYLPMRGEGAFNSLHAGKRCVLFVLC